MVRLEISLTSFQSRCVTSGGSRGQRSNVSRESNMANDMSSTAPDLVQCPVCFKDFKAATINKHLDVCLQESVTDSGPSVDHTAEPPVKKPRFTAESEPTFSPVNKTEAGSSSMAGSSSPPVLFSMFQTNKSKVSVPSERGGFVSYKQPAAAAVSKGLKRSLLSDVQPGTAFTDGQVSGSNKEIAKASHDISMRTLLTMSKPLAETLRPQTLEEYFGQNKVVGQQTLFRSLLDSQEIPSLILWGPPGCGKVGEGPECSIPQSFSQFPSLLVAFL